jgi:septation ring formation regulator EzrA
VDELCEFGASSDVCEEWRVALDAVWAELARIQEGVDALRESDAACRQELRDIRNTLRIIRGVA